MSRFFLGVTGGTGSGKTYVSKQIQKRLFEEGISCTIFDQDQYFYDEATVPKDENGKPNFDTPGSLDLNKYKNDFYRLFVGETVTQKRYNYNKPISDSKNVVEFNPAKVIILEGIFALFFEEIFNKLNLTVFVEADFATKLERRIKRDSLERGYDRDDVLYKFDYHVKSSYQKYIHPLKEKCDVLIKNSGKNDNLPESIDKILEIILERN